MNTSEKQKLWHLKQKRKKRDASYGRSVCSMEKRINAQERKIQVISLEVGA